MMWKVQLLLAGVQKMSDTKDEHIQELETIIILLVDILRDMPCDWQEIVGQKLHKRICEAGLV